MEYSLIEQVDSLFSAWDCPDSPGCVLGLVKEGEMIYSRGYGMANLEYGLPLTPQSVMYLASNSKQFTAACIVLLAQRGLISLQDDIRRYFPEMPAYAQPIRVEHLLYHTSGLREHGYLSDLAGLCPLDYRTADAVALICRQKDVNYPAGETCLYNNAGFVLQAGIIERVTGQSQPVFAKENIFDPLGMHDTTFSDDTGLIIKNRAASYEPNGGSGFRCLLMSNNVLGSAGVLTTVEDLRRWHQNFYEPRVGGEDFVRQMLATGRLNDGRSTGYGAGLIYSEVCGQKAISHGGTEFGYRSITMRFPEHHFSIFCLANLSTFAPAVIAEQIAGIFFEHRSAKQFCASNPVQPLSESTKQELAGFYCDTQSGAFIELVCRDGQLFAGGSVETSPLTVTGHSISFELETLRLEFSSLATGVRINLGLTKVRGDDGWTLQARLMDCDLPAMRQTPVWVPVENDLDGCTGFFYCEDLKAMYEIDIVDGQLALVNLTGLRGPLQPGPEDVFTIGGYALQFTRREGKADGFRLWGLSARGLEFVRFGPAGQEPSTNAVRQSPNRKRINE